MRENLIGAALTLLGANGPAIAAAAISRHAVAERVRRAWAAGAPGPGAVEEAMARYAEGEQRLGRIPPDADGAMLALALAGTVHRLLMHGGLQPAENARLVRRLVTALVPTANGLGASV